jgi:DNA-binding beta-propeller fold protein YncE
VVGRGDATLTVLDAEAGSLVDTLALPIASEPAGIVFAPDGGAAYVTLEATGRLLRLSPLGAITGSLDVGPHPRAVSVSGDASRIFVSRVVSPAARLVDPGDPGSIVLPEAEVREIAAAELAPVRTFSLHFDAGPDSEASGRGVPNFLGPAVISPAGRRALVPSKKDNVARGLFLDGQPLTFESRTRTILSELDLVANAEDAAARVDFNDREMAQSVLFSPLGDLVFVAFQGSNLVEVRDAADPTQRLATLATGSAPQGMAIDVDGLGRTLLYVQNFLSRSVSIVDVSSLVAATGNAVTPLAEVAAVSEEVLPPAVIAGKRIFYGARDDRMNRDGYLSCAGCHVGGGGDGQVWDHTQSGEGLRNTIELIGRGGVGHGNVHWTANFDEIQDFENDIRLAFSGTGFLSQADWLDTLDPLGTPKAGRSADLDALAAYVASLAHFPSSPYRNADGSLTAEGAAGKAVFTSAGCPACHAPPTFQDGVRHDVGTIRPGSGQCIGLPLAGVGIDTPTLKGLWRTAPYLHDGAAATLGAVLDEPAHVGTLAAAEKNELVAYLLQIDDRENPECSNFVDDDADLLVDLDDPDCSGPADDAEEPPPPPACSDGLDDDGDGLIDHPADPGCAAAADPSENDPALPCDDGTDDDGDGLVDVAADPGCESPTSLTEAPACQNGVDDDGDGKIDFDGGASLHGGVPVASVDPQCFAAYRNRERPASACGLGAEIAGVLLGLQHLARRRMRG